MNGCLDHWASAPPKLSTSARLCFFYGRSIEYFRDTVFNYPTHAEGYRIAALNGLNKI